MFVVRIVVLALLIVGGFILQGPTPAAAEIYRWVDEQGRVHFQDHPPEEKVPEVEVRDSSPSLPGVPVQVPADVPSQETATKSPAEAPGKSARIVRVELYTVAWCPWCKKAREFFRSQGVAFTDYDIEKDAAATARKNELDPKKGVPFAVVNGVKIRGYSPEAYYRALKSLSPGSP